MLKLKKRLTPIFALLTVVLSLSGCRFIEEYMHFGANSNRVQSRDKPIEASSRAPISDVSTPPAGDLSAKKMTYTYDDFIENNLYPLSATPSTGHASLLIIPVWFTDSSSFVKDANKENVREDIEKAYFGTNEETGWRSVKTYYEEESLGTLTLTGKVSAWYEVSESYRAYRTDSVDPDTGESNTSALVESAVSWYFTNHTSERRTDYDSDGDGYLDGVMLIYAAPDYRTLENQYYDNLWAYCFWIQNYELQNPSNPGVNVYFWASYDFMYGKEVASTRAGTAYCAGDTSNGKAIDSHTFIHEMGHMFGLEDYYDYSDHAYSPAGGFSMQDSNVGGHDPFSSLALGWGKAYIPTETTTINLKPFATSGEVILLTPNWNLNNSPFDEYLLLEYYTDDGLNNLDTTYKYMSQYGKNYPMGTKQVGIRLWHVDARLVYTTTGAFNPDKLTTNPRISSGRVVLAMSNTYYDNRVSEDSQLYISVLGKDYANYNILQLIRNNTNTTYKATDSFGSGSLFKAGNTFTMDNYSKQFVKGTTLNSGASLGFSFIVNACNNGYASITVTKL